MKNSFRFASFLAAIGSGILSASATTVTKSATGTDLANSLSWSAGVPTATDTAAWTSTSLGAALTLDAAASWQGIAVTGALTDIGITGTGALTLGSAGIDLTGTNLSIGNDIVLGSSQSWKATSGRSLSLSGAVSGSGNLTFGSVGASSTYNGYLSTSSGTPTLAFPGTTLSSITAVNGIINGAWISPATAATGYLFTNNGTTATVQLQFYAAPFTKVVKIQLTQSGPDVVAYQVYAKYKTGNYVGSDFDTLAVDGSPPLGADGYGVSSTTAIQGLDANGTIALSGNNSYTGTTTLNAGTLTLSGGNAIPNTSALTAASGSSFQLSASETIGSLAGAGSGALQGNVLTAGEDNSSTSYSGVLNGTGGSLVKAGTGTLTLTGSSSFTGGSTLSAGTIIAGNANALGTAALTINDANTGSNNTSLLLNSLNFARAITVANQGSGTTSLGANGTASNPTFTGAITLAKDLTLDGGATTDRLTFEGGIGGTGNITVAGTGRVMFLFGANTFSGNVSVNSGSMLQLDWGDVSTVDYIPDASVVTVDGMLKLAKKNSSETIGGLSGSGTVRGHEAVSNSASGLIINNSSPHTFGGVLENGGASGSTLSLTKSGSGTQTLSGANTYTGATHINGGTLALTGTATLPSSTITVASGASFDVSGLTGGFTVGDGKTLKGEGTVIGDVSDGAAGIGVITAGNGNSGTLSITGNLTFNGAADVNIGTLSNYTSTAAITVAGDVTAASSFGEIYLYLPTTSVDPGTYHLISHNNALADIDAFVLGSQPTLSSRQVGNLVNNSGSIDYVVSGANPAWTGALGSSWTTSALPAPKNWTLPGGGATDYIEGDVVNFNDTATGTTTVDLAMDVNPTSVNFNHSSKNYTIQSTGGFAIAAGSLTKTGTGVLTIANANTFFGDATLTAGTVRIGNDAALGTGNLVLNGGTLSSDSTTARSLTNPAVSVGGNVTLGDTTNTGTITLGGPVDLNAASRGLTTASDVILAGSITNGELAKDGPGTLVLTGTNSYGATTINGGTLNIGGGGATGSAGTGTITNNAALVVDHSGTPTLGGTINGTGSLTVTGGGTVTLGGLNEYTGTTTINGSTLVLGMVENYSTSHVGSLVTINSGGTLRLNTFFGTGFAYGFPTSGTPADITINPGGTFDKNGKATYIKNLTMNGNAAVIGSGATPGNNLQLCANLTATSTAAGAPSISGINLVAGTYTDAGNTRTIDVTHGAGSTEVDDLTIGVIGQQTPGTAANLIKTGNGTLKLTGANTYAGTTTVSQGTLKGATSFTGPLVVDSGTTLEPGDGIGTLAANATTLAGTYVCDVDATTSDVLAVTGNLNLTGATFTLAGTPAAASYTIATYTGSLTGTFTASPALPSGYSLDYSTTGQVKLVSNSGFSSWATANAPGETLDQDHDDDGVANGIEYFMGLSGSGFTANPSANASNVITWQKGPSYTGTYGTDFVVQISTDLSIWNDVNLSDVTDSAGSVQYDLDTLPAGAKKFARLKVTGP